MIQYAILSNSLSLLLKIKADGVGCGNGHEGRWEASSERQREMLARASAQVP